MKGKISERGVENTWKQWLYLEQVSKREHWSAPVPGGHSWHAAELRRRVDKNNKIAGMARKI